MKKGIIIILIVILFPFIILSIFYHEQGNAILVKMKRDNKIISVPLEEYVMGVVAGEMPSSFELEALKAQAIVSRSYVIYKIKKNNTYDVTDNTLTQVYVDGIYDRKIKKAVYETKNEVLVYDDEVIEALFFSKAPGYTENVEEVFQESRPYLRSVPSSWDNDSTEVNYFTKEGFCHKLDIECSNISIEITEKTSTGRSKKIKVNDQVFNSSDFIKRLNLKSSYLNIKVLDSNIIIETKGYGHGVGMSQYGANELAKKGYVYDEILKYYYQGTQIKKI